MLLCSLARERERERENKRKRTRVLHTKVIEFDKSSSAVLHALFDCTVSSGLTRGLNQDVKVS